MYDLETQTFRPDASIGRAFGVTNLYRDSSHAENVDHLEKALSVLEGNAAKAIKKIIKAAETNSPAFMTTRRELETIRKFIYVQHYRRVGLLSSYFDENDPDMASMREFMIRYRRDHNLPDSKAFWLHGLKYILETPHHKIVRDYELIQEKYGGEYKFEMMKMTRVDPDLESWYPVDYGGIATRFMSIWKASPGEEFVITSNSFGLFEGAVGGSPDVYRLFVVSPTVALVLVNQFLSNPQLSSMLPISTMFPNVKRPLPSPTYKHFDSSKYKTDAQAQAALSAYRVTPQAQEDEYRFQIVSLTKVETLTVNQVHLSHVPIRGGQIIFASTGGMRRSLEHFLKVDLPYIREQQVLLRSLYGLLNDEMTTDEADRKRGVYAVMSATTNGVIQFKSDYDRAKRLFEVCTTEVSPTTYTGISAEIHKLTALAIISCKKSLPEPSTEERHAFFDRSVPIVSSLPQDSAKIFFQVIQSLAPDVFTDIDIPLSATDFTRLKQEAAMFGFASWMAQNQPYELQDAMAIRNVPLFSDSDDKPPTSSTKPKKSSLPSTHASPPEPPTRGKRRTVWT